MVYYTATFSVVKDIHNILGLLHPYVARKIGAVPLFIKKPLHTVAN
jgi:hypothetical protein